MAIDAGRGWLAGLQNRDGGYPTFCRGWGRLPFDRSSVDLTAHALRANSRGNQQRAVRFLVRNQRSDGSWIPLWFGNQDRRVDNAGSGEDNPVYGTSRVLLAANFLPRENVDRAVQFLLQTQNRDGGWGGGASVTRYFHVPPSSSKSATRSDSRQDSPIESTVEETALAVEALAFAARSPRNIDGDRSVDDQTNQSFAAIIAAIITGTEFLNESVSGDRHRTAWPIGFYFAKLWYYEALYPTLFAMRALARVLHLTTNSQTLRSHRSQT